MHLTASPLSASVGGPTTTVCPVPPTHSHHRCSCARGAGDVVKTLAQRDPSMTAAFVGISNTVCTRCYHTVPFERSCSFVLVALPQHPHPHHSHHGHEPASATAAANSQPVKLSATPTYTGHYVTSPMLQGILFILLLGGALYAFIYMSLCLRTPETFEGDPIPGYKQK